MCSNDAAPDRSDAAPLSPSDGAAGLSADHHDPSQAVSALIEKLGQPRRHLSILLGAGASMAAGLPDLAALANNVRGELGENEQTSYDRLRATRDLEQLLSYLRAARALLESVDEQFDGLTSETAGDLDHAVTRAIATVLSGLGHRSDAHDRFARWVGRSLRPSPIEVFTTNYDLLIEHALDNAGVPYFDGFVGLHRGAFRPDLIEPDEGDAREQLPAGWVRLWKLHGSVAWALEPASRRIVRLVGPASAESVLAIYPTAEKYEQSRRLPFLAMMDRLRRALGTPESTTLVAGYSFGDEHINELIFDAAARHQRSEIIALCYGDIPPPLRDRAARYANLTVYGKREAVLSGEVKGYAAGPAGSGWDGTHITVGDFNALARILPRAEREPESLWVGDARSASD